MERRNTPDVSASQPLLRVRKTRLVRGNIEPRKLVGAIQFIGHRFAHGICHGAAKRLGIDGHEGFSAGQRMRLLLHALCRLKSVRCAEKSPERCAS
jgi:hypothetical protein